MKADLFAAERHRGQTRRDGVTPYIAHPRAVTAILSNAGISDIVVLQAALLHDTIEDTATSYDDLVAEFGVDVADVVLEVTDDKSLPKQARKDEQVRHAPNLSDRAAMLKTADKIANMRDILHAPPPWPAERKRGYFDHARAVVSAMGSRGIRHALLRAHLNVTYSIGAKIL